MKTRLKCIVSLSLSFLFLFVQANDAIKWTFRTSGEVIAAPVIKGDTLFVGSLDGYFYALSTSTGVEIWKFNANNEIRTTAAIYDNQIICFESGNAMIGLDLSGNLLWSTIIHDGAINNQHDQWDCFRSSPTLRDSIAYVGSEQGKVIGVNVKNGQIEYSVQTPQANATIETTPAIYKDKIFVGDWLGVFSVFSLESANLVWQYDTKLDNTYAWVNAIVSKPLIYNDVVYFGGRNCNLYAFNPDSGEKLWMYHQPDDKWLFGGPVVSEGAMYVGSSYQEALYAFDPDGAGLLWETNVGGLNYGDPIVVDDYVIVGTGGVSGQSTGSLTIVNKLSHQIDAKLELNGWIQTTPLVKDGVIYFGCYNRKIYAVDMYKLLKKDPPSNTKTHKLSNWEVFPNPVKSKLKIQTKTTYNNLEVSLINLSGQKILSVCNQSEIDISQIETGVYFIEVNIDGDMSRKKIIKKS